MNALKHGMRSAEIREMESGLAALAKLQRDFLNYARLHRTRSVEPTTSTQQIKWDTLVDYSHTEFLSSKLSNIDRCDNATLYERWAMPLDTIEANSIGVEPDVDEGGWRYSMPFSTKTEKNDLIFCNGYESCPTD
jgi:hypothetical protein